MAESRYCKFVIYLSRLERGMYWRLVKVGHPLHSTELVVCQGVI
jgi:hypothetical protein